MYFTFVLSGFSTPLCACSTYDDVPEVSAAFASAAFASAAFDVNGNHCPLALARLIWSGPGGRLESTSGGNTDHPFGCRPFSRYQRDL